jgi:peptidoglycan/LPS O-acetylase OafA/YrhL
MWSDGITILTPSTFDALGIGGLLAMLWRSTLPVDRIVNRVAAVALVIFVAERAIIQWVPAHAQVTPATTVWWSLFFVWCVHHTARGVGGPIGRVLSFRPLHFIGTVSYGVYLFHIFVVPASEIFERKTSIDLPLPESWGWARFVAVTIITVAAAALSWRLFERPINSRKRHFPYVSPSASLADTAPGVSRAAVPPPGRVAFAGQGTSGGEWSEPGPGGG